MNQYPQKNSKNTVENLKKKSKSLLKETELFIELVEDNSLENEQFFLDFLDKLNELSIKY